MKATIGAISAAISIAALVHRLDRALPVVISLAVVAVDARLEMRQCCYPKL